MTKPVLTPKQKAWIEKKKRPPVAHGYRLLVDAINPRQPFKLPGSSKQYYGHFVGATRTNPRGKFAGIRVVGGRKKVGRNAPGYRQRQLARGKIVAPGIRLSGDGYYRIVGEEGLKFLTPQQAKEAQSALQPVRAAQDSAAEVRASAGV